jgi:hypothetical protein
MFDTEVRGEVERVASVVADLCDAIDPNAINLGDVPAVFEQLVRMSKLIDGATVRMTARYEEAGEWKRNGARSAADDIARKTGKSPSQAKRSLGTSQKLAKLPGTDNALRKGDLSADQADQVASGAAVSPEDEDDLLDTARNESMHALRRKAADARARADHDRQARARRLHGMRRVSRWTDEDGLYNLLLKTTPEVGASIDAHLKPGIDQAYADARDAGRFEDYEAYAADVVAGLLTGQTNGATTRSGQAVRPDRKVIATVDAAALRRGTLEGDETCVIAGVGPVSVNAVRALLGDAALAVVFEDGVDILNVTHFGHQVTAHQRTALEARGYRCEVCGATSHLDIDHVTGFTITKTTRLDDLSWLCRHHHHRKTYEDLVLVGPVGHRRLVPRPPTDGSNSSDPPDDDGQFSLAL